jgi:hypothetical protein
MGNVAIFLLGGDTGGDAGGDTQNCYYISTSSNLSPPPHLFSKKSELRTQLPKLKIKTYISKKSLVFHLNGGEVGTNHLKCVHSKD